MIRPVALSLCLLASVPVAAQTVDEIIQRNVDARGGYDRLRAIRTIRVIGRQPIGGQGQNMTEATPDVQRAVDAMIASEGAMVVTLEAKRPNLMRRTYAGPNLPMAVVAFDGTAFWRWTSGQSKPVKLPPTAEPPAFGLDGLLVDCERNGYRVELVGKAKAEGKACYKLKITSEHGRVQELYVDATTYLDVRLDSKSGPPGARTVYRSWRSVEGFMVPGAIVTTGGGHTIQWIIDKVEFNVPIDDERFIRPEQRR